MEVDMKSDDEMKITIEKSSDSGLGANLLS